jgi:hypothetical protein
MDHRSFLNGPRIQQRERPRDPQGARASPSLLSESSEAETVVFLQDVHEYRP